MRGEAGVDDYTFLISENGLRLEVSLCFAENAFLFLLCEI